MLNFAGADAEGQRAEGAMGRRVTVAANDGLARLSDAEFRSNHMHDPLIGILHVEEHDARFAAVALQGLKLRGRHRIQQRKVPVLGGHGVVHDRKRKVRSPHLASRRFQAGESLRGCSFVNEMAVDIDERGLRGLFSHQVGIPDLFVHCACRHNF